MKKLQIHWLIIATLGVLFISTIYSCNRYQKKKQENFHGIITYFNNDTIGLDSLKIFWPTKKVAFEYLRKNGSFFEIPFKQIKKVEFKYYEHQDNWGYTTATENNVKITFSKDNSSEVYTLILYTDNGDLNYALTGIDFRGNKVITSLSKIKEIEFKRK